MRFWPPTGIPDQSGTFLVRGITGGASLPGGARDFALRGSCGAKDSTPSVDFQPLVESRLVKRKSPVALQPEAELLACKETMLAELRGVRERTLSFLLETHGRDCSVYCWRHPFLGTLNFFEWFTLVAAHQIRHTKQMVEIWKNLPKHVASSQK